MSVKNFEKLQSSESKLENEQDIVLSRSSVIDELINQHSAICMTVLMYENGDAETVPDESVSNDIKLVSSRIFKELDELRHSLNIIEEGVKKSNLVIIEMINDFKNANKKDGVMFQFKKNKSEKD